jgi:hypothetical protein
VPNYRPTMDGSRPTLDEYRSTLDGYRPTFAKYRSTLDGYRPTLDEYRSTLDRYRPSGEVFMKTPAILYADKYLFETCEVLTGTAGPITNAFSNSPKNTSVGNTVGQPMWSRVTPIGSFKTLSPSIWYKLDIVT